jgi:hypothetical protein
MAALEQMVPIRTCCPDGWLQRRNQSEPVRLEARRVEAEARSGDDLTVPHPGRGGLSREPVDYRYVSTFSGGKVQVSENWDKCPGQANSSDEPTPGSYQYDTPANPLFAYAIGYTILLVPRARCPLCFAATVRERAILTGRNFHEPYSPTSEPLDLHPMARLGDDLPIGQPCRCPGEDQNAAGQSL